VDLAHNGQEAVECAAKTRYDCVLMDIQMPVMDGYTATRQIHALEGCADLPVLAMTANVLADDRAKAKQAGLVDHIPKPIDPQTLYRKLLQWIEPGEREPLEAAPAASPDSHELPDELPGIRISEGMKRVGDNARLYVKLLLDLRADYAGAAATIAELHRSGDSAATSQLAHKLRGIANNLGATEVGATAEKIENAAKAGQPASDDMLAALAKSLATLVDSIGMIEQLAAPASGSVSMSKDEIDALLLQLDREIADNDPAAEATVEKLLQALDETAAAYAPLVSVRDAIDIYDFAAAVEHVAAARQSSGA
jgi:CheY-like chemotaxis protein